jgi:hypothetical protein
MDGRAPRTHNHAMHRSSRSVALASLCCSFALLACSGSASGPLTEIVVVVDTDLAVPSQVKSLRVVARGPDGASKMVSGPLTGPNAITLPLSFGATAPGSGAFSVTATGVGPSDSPVIVRDVVTAFVEGERRILHIVLGADCYQRACTGGDTCLEGGACGSPDVSADDLPAFDGVIPDAVGTSAAPDASFPEDAGIPDATLDAGPDGGVACGAEERGCNDWRPERDESTCGRVTCLPTNECGFDPNSALVSCAMGFACDYSTGSCRRTS